MFFTCVLVRSLTKTIPTPCLALLSKMKHSKLVYSCKFYPKLVYTLGMVLKNSSYQEWTKSNQTIKIKPWKSKDLEDLEIKQSNLESWRFGKLEDWKIFESCKLRKLNILKVEKLKFGKFKLKAGEWKDELDSWVKF